MISPAATLVPVHSTPTWPIPSVSVVRSIDVPIQVVPFRERDRATEIDDDKYLENKKKGRLRTLTI